MGTEVVVFIVIGAVVAGVVAPLTQKWMVQRTGYPNLWARHKARQKGG
jgi:hypothetical protein